MDTECPPSGSNWACLDGWLGRYWLRVLATFVVLSGLLRLGFFVELNTGPCIWLHRWNQSDMNFFHLWANRIAKGDLLSANVDVPLHLWHKDIAKEVFRRRPDILETIQDHANDPNADLAQLLWNQWCGQKRFYQEPGYPYLIAGTYRLFGPDQRWVFGWQLVLGAGSILLICTLVRWYYDHVTATVAGALATFCGPLLFYEMALLRTTLITFTGLGLVVLIEWARRRHSWRWWGLVGVTTGLAMLIKSHVVLILIGVVAILGVRTWRAPRQSIPDLAAVLIGMAIGLLPLIVRNTVVGVEPFSFTSAGGVTFIGSNTPDYPGRGPAMSLTYAPDILIQTEGALGPTVIKTLQTHDHPGSYATLLWDRLNVIFHWYEMPNNCNFYYFRLHSRILRYLPITFLVIGPLGLMGLILSLRAATRFWPLLLLLVAHFTVLLAFFTTSRFRVPFMAALIPPAAHSLVWILKNLSLRHFGRVAIGIACLFALGLWTGRPLAPTEPLIRWVDFMVPLRFFYGPAADEAIARGDWSSAVRTMGDAVRIEPADIRRIDEEQPPLNANQARIAQLFATAHHNLSVAMANDGRASEAFRHLNRAQQIERTLQRTPRP